MESYKDIEVSLVEVSNGDVVECKESFAQSLLYATVGVVLLVVSRNSEALAREDAWLLSCYMISVAFLIAGAVKFFFRKTKFLYLPTREKMRRTEVCLNTKEEPKILEALERGDFAAIGNFRAGCDAPYRMVVYGSKKSDVMYVQLLKYQPFEFFAITESIRCEGVQLQSLRELLRQVA